MNAIIHYLAKLGKVSSKLLSRRGVHTFLKSQLNGLGKGSNVLSVGAGGAINQTVKELGKLQGFSVVEMDIDPVRAPDIVGDICTDSYPEEYDVVVLMEVLEHVRCPTAAIGNVWNSLAPGGRLIGSTPFLFPMHDQPNDFFRYTRHQLSSLLSRFTDIHVVEKTGLFGTIAILLSRSAFSDNRLLRLVSFPLAGLALIFWPLSLLLDRIFPTQFAPAGYFFTATK